MERHKRKLSLSPQFSNDTLRRARLDDEDDQENVCLLSSPEKRDLRPLPSLLQQKDHHKNLGHSEMKTAKSVVSDSTTATSLISVKDASTQTYISASSDPDFDECMREIAKLAMAHNDTGLWTHRGLVASFQEESSFFSASPMKTSPASPVERQMHGNFRSYQTPLFGNMGLRTPDLSPISKEDIST